MKIEEILKTERDHEIWNHLVTDLNRPHDVPKKQVMRQFELIYSRWFSKEVDIKQLRVEFERQVVEWK